MTQESTVDYPELLAAFRPPATPYQREMRERDEREMSERDQRERERDEREERKDKERERER